MEREQQIESEVHHGAYQQWGYKHVTGLALPLPTHSPLHQNQTTTHSENIRQLNLSSLQCQHRRCL